MSRMRTVKPSFFLNEDLAQCSFPSRLLFEALWCLADRAGRLEDRPAKIKHEALPHDDVNVEELLDELAASRSPFTPHGFITRYEVEGIPYIQVNAFDAHQKPHPREPESVIPPPPIHPNADERTAEAVEKNGSTVPSRESALPGPVGSLVVMGTGTSMGSGSLSLEGGVGETSEAGSDDVDEVHEVLQLLAMLRPVIHPETAQRTIAQAISDHPNRAPVAVALDYVRWQQTEIAQSENGGKGNVKVDHVRGWRNAMLRSDQHDFFPRHREAGGGRDPAQPAAELTTYPPSGVELWDRLRVEFVKDNAINRLMCRRPTDWMFEELHALSFDGTTLRMGTPWPPGHFREEWAGVIRNYCRRLQERPPEVEWVPETAKAAG